jgi:hypothetical protein
MICKKPVSLRISDQIILDKLDMIAVQDGRSRNKEILFMISKYIKDVEQSNGIIQIDQNVLSQIRNRNRK